MRTSDEIRIGGGNDSDWLLTICVSVLVVTVDGDDDDDDDDNDEVVVDDTRFVNGAGCFFGSICLDRVGCLTDALIYGGRRSSLFNHTAASPRIDNCMIREVEWSKRVTDRSERKLHNSANTPGGRRSSLGAAAAVSLSKRAPPS